MPLIELYLGQQQSIVDSFEEFENAEARLDQLVNTLQEPELQLKQIDTYLQAKSNVESLRQIHDEYIFAHERTKLQIMEILLTFPHLKKITLNQSKTRSQCLLWDLEESVFTLAGFGDEEVS